MCPACALGDTRTWPLWLTFRYFWSQILTWVPEVFFLERRGASSAAGRHVFGLWPKARRREKKPETAHEKPLAPRVLRDLPLVTFASFGGIAKSHVWALSWLSSLSTRNRELGSGTWIYSIVRDWSLFIPWGGGRILGGSLDCRRTKGGISRNWEPKRGDRWKLWKDSEGGPLKFAWKMKTWRRGSRESHQKLLTGSLQWTNIQRMGRLNFALFSLNSSTLSPRSPTLPRR